MQKLYKIPLLFLFIAACIGMFLRFQLVAPIEGVVYSYLLHAHSHVMFLGWVFNVLIIAFIDEFTGIPRFKLLFWFLQCCIAAMLISFPMQGYGVFSIIFSTLHTVGAFIFIILFFRSCKLKSFSVTLAKASLIFFALSSLGPFLLGYLKANGLDQSNLYRFSIYFYLHFQYNGFFLFGILALFIKLIKDKIPDSEIRQIATGSQVLVWSCIPAYSLSLLWARPGIIFNIIGFGAGIAQLIGVLLLFGPLRRAFKSTGSPRLERFLVLVSSFAFILKFALQMISAFPAVAVFANEFRSIVIAYLHLVLFGGITLFLVAWLMWKKIIASDQQWAIGIILTGFIGSQILLIISPWSNSSIQLSINLINEVLFFFSVMMVFGIAALLLRSSNT